MTDNRGKYRGPVHSGPERSAPYPVSRLAPPIDLVDLARQIGEADQAINARTGAKLQVIAGQIRALQQEARKVLEEARHDQDLHRARCMFRKLPGHVYYLYQAPDDGCYFSMLSPEDWQGHPPHSFKGSYRLEADMSWTPADTPDEPDNARELMRSLLEDNGS